MTAAPRGRRAWWWLLAAVVLFVLFVVLAPGTCSLLGTAFILAYVCAPAVERLSRRMPRAAATATILLGVALLLIGTVLLLVPVVMDQWRRLAERLPQVVSWFNETLVPWVEAQFAIEIPETGQDLATILQGHFSTVGGKMASPLGQLVAKTFGGVMGIVSAIANALLTPVLTFYLLDNWPKIWPRIESIVPRRHVVRVRTLKDEIDTSLAGFVRGHLTVSALIGTLQAIGLSIVGIDGAIVIGLLGGFLNLIPYLGVAIGLTLALLMAILEFQGWGPIIGVLIVFGIVQVLEGTVITPRIVGDRVGLSPLFVIIAILAGGEMFGFAGLLLAIPGAAVIRVLVREAVAAYRGSPAYSAATSPAARIEPPKS